METGLTVDGQFGNMTRLALKAVQYAVGVRDDGSFGPITRNAMSWRWIVSGTSSGGTFTLSGCSPLQQPLAYPVGGFTLLG